MKSSVIYVTENRIRFVDSSEAFKVETIDTASLKKDDIPHHLKNFLKEHKFIPEHLTLGIPRTQANIRFLTFPTVNEAEIRQMIEYDITSLFPAKPQDLVFDHVVIAKDESGYSKVMLVAVDRDFLQKSFQALKHAGLAPDGVSLSTVSLCNQIKSQENRLFIYQDDGFIEILYFQNGKLEFSRAVSFSAAVRILPEIVRTVDVLRSQGETFTAATLGGRGGLRESVKELEKAINAKIDLDDETDVMKALAQNDHAFRINLLPGEFKIRKTEEKRKRSLIYLAILSLLNLALAANIVFFKLKAKEEFLEALRGEIKKIDTKAGALQKKLIKVKTVQGYLNSGRLKLGLLSEIYRIAPEGIFLNSLEITGSRTQGTIILIGQARDSETVLRFAAGLKGSAYLTKTDVDYMTKRKVGIQELVDFEIKASF